MKLHVAPRAPNPRRVTMFMAEKGIGNIDLVNVDVNGQQHRTADFLALSPFAKLPVLVLDDGRALSESRAICTYLEGQHPEPNLMGRTAEERAFIEMADRQCELYLMNFLATWVRHSHPGLAVLEGQQFPEFGAKNAARARETCAALDQHLATHEWMAAGRFTIADITAFCGLEFARGLMKFKPGEEGFKHLQAWRDRVAARASAAT